MTDLEFWEFLEGKMTELDFLDSLEGKTTDLDFWDSLEGKNSVYSMLCISIAVSSEICGLKMKNDSFSDHIIY